MLKISLTFGGEKTLDLGVLKPNQEDKQKIITQDNLAKLQTIRHKITCRTNTSFLRETAGGVELPEAPAVVFMAMCVNQKLGSKSQHLKWSLTAWKVRSSHQIQFCNSV